MDCLRSGLEGPDAPAGFESVLEGLPNDADGVLPKKSKPSRESPGFVSLGGAAEPRGGIGGGFVPDGSVVLGRAGGDGVSSLKKSTFCTDRRGGSVGWLDAVEARCEEARSSFAFCCTRLRGYSTHRQHHSYLWRWSLSKFKRTTSSSPSVSRVAGSGILPSITHLFDSYFVRIKFSIFLIKH